ncbi:MAG: hypothetical protein HUK17_03560 [Bacteroidales bacterium]|nr:hypothetical protein [Bacteroidales bacterium]
MKTNKLFAVSALVAMLALGAKTSAQVDFNPVINTLRMESRFDFDYISHLGDAAPDYGFHGKYFNLHVGGYIGEQFSYYFRQRIQANPGSIAFYDNTDFLYINYMPNKNWMFRLGKDALAVGGFEYDAAPIDVLFATNYWDNFYCFQLALAGAYKSDDGNHMLLAQVANSPYVHTDGAPWQSGLMSYNLYWSGNFGHFKTLYSANMFERERGHFMNYIALGHKLVYEKWDLYLDLIHHALYGSDWGKNYAVVGCFNYYATKDLSFYAKAAYEQNRSDYNTLNLNGNLNPDCLILSQHAYTSYGIGCEYRPSFCKSVRLHGVVAMRHATDYTNPDQVETTNSLNVNLGITWNMDFLKLINK